MKSNIDSQAQQILRRAELYRTKSRLAITKVLLRADKPLSQDEIAQRLGEVRLNKVTVYRTLECLCKAGLLHKAYMQERACHFELARNCTESQCHPHFTCTNCGQTQCMVGLSFPMVKGLRGGFVVHRQQVRLEGLCPACA